MSDGEAALDLLLDTAGEDAARRIVRAIGTRTAQAALERQIVKRYAIHLLERRAPRWEIRDRLISRGLSWATAYRVIDAALGAGPRCLTEGPAVIQPLPSIQKSQPIGDLNDDRTIEGALPGKSEGAPAAAGETSQRS